MKPHRFSKHELETMIELCKFPAPKGTHPAEARWRKFAGKLVAELEETQSVARDLLVFAKDAVQRGNYDGACDPEIAIARAKTLQLETKEEMPLPA